MTTAVSQARTRSVTTAIINRNVTARRRFIGSLGLAMFAFALMVGAIYPSIGTAYDEVLDDLPAAFEGMLGGADFSTAEGFLQVELFAFLAPALAIAAGVSVGAGALAGSEQDGHLALVMANPLARSHIVSAALGSVVVAVGAVNAALFVGILGGAAIGGLDLDVSRTVEACVSLGLLAIASGAMAVAAGALTGKRGVAVATASAIAITSYAIDAFFPLSSTLEPFAKLSLWYPYGHNQPIINGLVASHVAILIAVSLLTSAAAYWFFEHRDLS